jgi:hypothetical protein
MKNVTVPAKCPFCDGQIHITDFACDDCGATVRGIFDPCSFCGLNTEQRRYLISFIKCRGNIKEIEKDLGISYPTVRARMDDLLIALGLTEVKSDTRRADILASLETGEISAEEAAQMLKKL